ncbi:MAG: YicC/YloC family endoribonuclease [Pseudomonadota bacterium]
MAGAIASMTGFARVAGAHGERRWIWEMKSVNGRGLELRFRLPPGFEEAEATARKALQSRFKRGSVYASLQIETAENETRMRLNETALGDAIAAIEKIQARIQCAPPQAEGLLSIRGIIELSGNELDESARAELIAAVIDSFNEAADALGAARTKEGEALSVVLAGLLDQIDANTRNAAALAEAAPETIRKRISDQLADLLVNAPVPEERLAQEAAIMAVKADIREELDRLLSHVSAGRALLTRGGAVGRELDFLTQELNRETNTLCAKAQEMALKRIGLDLKQVIDQFREQVQNIE